MASNQHQRQTRSQTKAIREAMKANLQIASSHASENCGILFEATFVEANRGHERDCISCDQRNDADKFMVQCMGCQGWEHFKCAGVTTANAHEIAYRCVMCRPRIPPPAPSSITAESTASSSRRARIARDLERLEEERKLHETAAKAQMDRDKTYLNKKYKLLEQQDEENERDSARSKRSSQAGSCRVTDWVKDQSRTVERSNRDVVTMPSESAKAIDSGRAVEPTLVSQLGGPQTSTPLTKPIESEEKTPAAVVLDLASWIVDLDRTSLQRTTGSISVGECQDNESAATDDAARIPLVDIQPFLRLLKDVESNDQRTGAYPKPSQPTFDKWRLEIDNLRRVQNLQQQHAQENDIRRKREIELMQQLKLVEQQRRADAEEMQKREAEYRRQIRSQEEERIEHRKQTERALEERDRELSRLRLVEQQLMSRLNQFSQPNKTLSPEMNIGPVYYQNCQPAAGNNTLPQNDAPSVSELFTQHNPFEKPINASMYENISTPIGRRTPCYDFPEVTPPMLPQQPPYPPTPVAPIVNPSYETNHVRDHLSGPTSQQLAARHVGRKELPVFSGDPVDWPLFYSSYQHSTELCGFSNSENLLRLQQSLRGNAKEAVSSFLLHPSTVPEVIETLKTLFGRPEQIVHHMVNKVRSTPAPKEHRLDMLMNFGLVVQNMCSHLKAVGLQNHLSDPTLLKELVDKLPPTAQFNWALYQTQFPLVDLNVFSKYMQYITTATSGLVMNGGINNATSRSKGREFVHTHAEIVDDSEQPESSQTEQLNHVALKPCVACQKFAHPLEKCFKFQNMSTDERWKLIKQNNKLCRRCLVAHSRWPCKGEVCGINDCSKKHHRLLHFDPQESTSARQHATVSIHREVTSSILFRLLPVTLFGSKGNVQTFAFLDDGSSVTMLEESLADELGGDGITTSLCIQWTGGVNKNISNTRIMEFEIAETSDARRHKLSEVYTVESLDLPEQSLHFDRMSQEYPHLQGLPVTSYESAVPRLLIGLNNAHLIMPLKAREGRQGEPVATKTRIGWSIFGRVPRRANTLPHHQLHICATKSDDNLHEFVKNFFSIESLGIRAAPELQTLEDQRAYKILSETTKRTSSGRFEVSLLWKYNYIEFPDSRPMAEKRWKCLERRLTKNPALYDKIRQQIADYQLKGYAHKATQAEFESFDLRRTWFLPMGVVLNPKKPEKVRLIWDAAAKVDGVSLNSMLMKGPDLLTSLLSILFRYREREVAIAADIREMFHQILVRPEDRSAQLFLWRDSPDKPLDIMVMDVAIFGATCSPAHAQFVKNLNAAEYQRDYPRAADAITRWHYVDDYVQCVDTVEEAVELALQVTEVHSKGKFEIVNWISNRNEVLQQIGANNPTVVKNMQFGDESEGQRLLGMIWQPSSDVFSFPVQFSKEIADLINCETVPTKRQLLKLVMSLYDPLGLISAFTIHGKIIIQEVWREKVAWDDKIPEEIFTKWKLWLSALPGIECLKIKRCYFPGYTKNTYDNVQLHIFVDASEQAYAAVAYLRVVEDNKVRCALVSSKTKVAPLKILSIPRLELLAALIGARLRKVIEEEHTLTIHEVLFWSDSTTVLSWIRSDMRRYNRFVAHRINEILELSKIEEWRWVPTRLNVADEATKWGKGPSFDAESRWYKAPEFLYELDENEWPKDRIVYAEVSKEELRIDSVHAHVARVPIIDINRFSKWERLLRVTGYVHYFEDCYLKKFLGKQINTIGMNSDHLKRAERALWRIAQNDSFPKEVDILRHNNQTSVPNRRKISKSSSISSMGPTIDEFGVIRVDGRMQAADWMEYDAKYPIILPRDHRITYLVLDWYHRNYGHANDETVVNELRQRFRIPRLRVELKKVKKACQWCKVYKASPVAPKMGPLPRVRLTPFVRPFTFTGIDYFGPYLIKIGRKAVKRWVVLFTCLTLRAVHLEVAANMSSDSCKKAIRRFVARRGAPEEIYTDNGTNFLGVSRELRTELKAINNELGSTFTDTRTQWYFIPPAAPHMGGCWERMVRSVKTALKSVPTVDKFDEESFLTVLIEAEHMINSRPLTFIPIRSENEESLTPNHFLMLGSKGVRQGVKRPILKGTVIRCSWDLIQRVLQIFWQRWVVEYLPTITRRTKWFEDVRPINDGELVVIADEGARNRWIRGRVIKMYPGKDGVSRMADIQISGGVLSRPCTKLALLDVK